MKRRTVLAAGIFACMTARAEDTGRQRRNLAIAISKELRDPASANYTLFESESSIAGELKAEIYKQLAEGKTREEILAFFTARYGEQIRYDPALTGGTALLWAAPWVLFAAAGAAAFWRFKRRRQTNE
ncbi:cytochrome c-type biogenesis protein [Duodenibacillus massiliensis]|uniref:cytochrome c-type biogenesis protein n=1 Tax=Duodenibacillus massiliensis TaxID=1852381 RepID=UPI00033C5F32|nr:cytochrome c-type biogenesis protein [Duodenibacillus massiliensis]MBS5791879.1 cytochrome c-type biogenesis protein CcmH [Sutterella sp.]CDD69833.1 putative cytochrome C-type biogenesis protein CcmH [Sutterella sp. CAG:397]